MGANNYILALYGISALMAFTCPVIPGATRQGRAICIIAGLALIGWPAATFLIDDPYPVSPVIAVVPLIFLLYGLATAHRYLRDHTWLPGGQPAQAGLDGERRPDRRGHDRRTLPGEFGHLPINQAPPRHDPWAAFYAATERSQLRSANGRHRSPSIRHHALAGAPRDGHTHQFRPAGRAWFLSNIEEVSRRDPPRG